MRRLKISEHEPILQRHRQLMATVPTKKLYRRRIAIVEPVFGLLKAWHGATPFLLRGRSHVMSEWHLLATAFNLKSLHAVCRSGVSPASPSGAGPLHQQVPCLTAAPRPHQRRLRHFRHFVHTIRNLTASLTQPTMPHTEERHSLQGRGGYAEVSHV